MKEVLFMNKDYAVKLFIQSGVSKSTANSYVMDISLCENWLKKDIDEATKMDLVDYIDYMLQEKKAAPASINRTIYALKKYYDVMEVSVNPAANLRRIKVQRNSPTIFDLEQMEIILNSLPKRNKERNKLIIVLAAICGLRKSEIVNLDVDDFNGTQLSVFGKGNKVRYITISNNISNLIKKYLKERTEGPMFISEQGNRLSIGAVDNIMSGLKKSTNFGVHMHKFRHTAATYAYRQDKNLRAVQEMLGHSSPNTTQIYVHVGDEEIRSMIESSPVSKLI